MLKPLVAGSIALAAVTMSSPQAAVEELLATDRTFASKASSASIADVFSAMYADDVVVPVGVPQPGFARGRTQAIEALKANADNAQGKLAWTPIRGGVSSDGQHGFTIGYMTLTRNDGSQVPIKYVAYWVKRAEGWRVAVYKRVVADASPQNPSMLAPAVPATLRPPTTDSATIARHKASLEAAEKAFSDEAQKIGLGPAFAKHGSADAVNVGPRNQAEFTFGAEDIGKSVGAGSEGKPSPVRWAADEGSIVASSGDLGVTFGYIRQNAPAADGRPSAVPFITIWRRATVTEPWRYVAE